MWFRRRSFGDMYDSIPKWHLESEHEDLQWTAACEYKYTFYYESPLVSEIAPPAGESCRKCIATIPVAGGDGPGGSQFKTPALVRFPTFEEQRRGMLVVPRHKRTMKEEQDG